MPDTDQARIRDQALPRTDQASLDPLMDRIGDARYVLLGEASHGTADYYQVRNRDRAGTAHRSGAANAGTGRSAMSSPPFRTSDDTNSRVRRRAWSATSTTN